VNTFPVPRRGTKGKDIRYILVNDRATLVWLANLANLEIHPFLHCVPALNRPTSVVFDLDPGEGTDILTCAHVAFILRTLLSDLHLESWVKVSGSKGLQLYVPLNTDVTYDFTQPFAKAVADLLSKREDKLIVSEMAKELRRDRVFIDWSQNADFKTTVGVYSLRAKAMRPYVSMPVRWEELETAMQSKNSDSLYFDIEKAIDRVQSAGDLFEPLLSLKQTLPPDVLKHLGAARPVSLRRYAEKRDFAKTSEPAPSVVRRSRQGSRRRFVIQKHAASHLHYDFRLEMHDTLKSWAVPKGPPYLDGEKRLAMPTEDHPLDYLEFEGVIPQGQYGGGTVMVWDIGTYELLEGNYYKGYLRFHLNGQKLKGEWELVRDANDSSRNRWSFVKRAPGMRVVSRKRDDKSALSNRSMADIAAAKDATWHSNRAPDTLPDVANLPDADIVFVEPMLAKLVETLPEGGTWQYELKLDGYRSLAAKTNESVRLMSRRGNTVNRRFPSIGEALTQLPSGTIVDGEIVALDAEGKPSFGMLQHSVNVPADSLRYYLFDILAWRGKDVRALPLSERRLLLKDVARELSPPILVSEVFHAGAADLIDAIRKAGLEGIVAKKIDSKYQSGDRNGAWVKYKTYQAQEFVIGGYKPGKYQFEYLLAGYYDHDRLIFVAKIKNGFVPQTRRDIAEKFNGLESATCPFSNLPEPKNARRGEAITREIMPKLRWLKPKLVAQIEFAEWTSNGHLRHSRFVALRDDKLPSEVLRERPA
jgi:bifunctional non-homologous end joining protein LigD